MFVGWWIPFSWHSGILSVYGAKAKVDLSREEKGKEEKKEVFGLEEEWKKY